MRLGLVLLLSGLAVWAFLKLFPTADPAVRADGGPNLTVPAAPAPSGESLPARADLGVEPPPPPEPAVVLPTVEGNPFAPSAVASRAADEALAELGAALAHGEDQAVAGLARDPAAGLAGERRAALEAVLRSLAGQPEAARQQAAALLSRAELPEREGALVAAALGAAPFPLPPAPAPSALERALEIRLSVEAARAALERHPAQAARHLGRALRLELGAPWPASHSALAAWSELLRQAQGRHRFDPRGDWPHQEIEVESGDSWTSVRKRALAARADVPLSTGLIAHVNGTTDEDILRAGQRLRVPTEPVSVLVDVSARWLLLSIGDEVLESFPVGVGREGEETLLGHFVAGGKQKEPTWWPRNRAPVPFGDPENPLGTRWISWRVPGEAADTSYGFHGTKDPASIGHAASEGCVRMHNRDVELLYELLPLGSAIEVRG
jgi:hypothetical protein